MNIFINSAQYGVAFWLPTLVAGFGLTSPTNSQLLNIPTAVVYIIAALAQGWILDNTTRIPKPAMMLTYAAVMAGEYFLAPFSSWARLTTRSLLWTYLLHQPSRIVHPHCPVVHSSGG